MSCILKSPRSSLAVLAVGLFMLLSTLIASNSAFKCYVCDSKSDIECTENLPTTSRLKPQDCGNLTGAKYCIKTTNLYAGELGTKRFCASNDQGSYCRYVRQPTGDREYRSCVLTCDSEACNAASGLADRFATVYMALPCIVLATIIFYYHY